MTSGYQLLTGAAPAAIASVRLCGPESAKFLEKHVQLRTPSRLEPGSVRRASLLDQDGAVLDDILVSSHAAPPDGDVRLHLHGSPWLVARVCELAERAGLNRVERPIWEENDGLAADLHQFLPQLLTRRAAEWAFANLAGFRGVLAELSQLDPREAARRAAALLSAPSVAEWFTRPARIAMVGPPNAGKSTLLNSLAREPVSIVSATAGTTRDWLEVPTEVHGFPVTWIDTAGMRDSPDALERAGVQQTQNLLRIADAVVVVLDCTSSPEQVRQFAQANPDLPCSVLAWNKTDLRSQPDPESLAAVPQHWQARMVFLSAVTQHSLHGLGDAILSAMGRSTEHLEQPGPATPLQRSLLERIARDMSQ